MQFDGIDILHSHLQCLCSVSLNDRKWLIQTQHVRTFLLPNYFLGSFNEKKNKKKKLNVMCLIRVFFVCFLFRLCLVLFSPFKNENNLSAYSSLANQSPFASPMNKRGANVQSPYVGPGECLR